MRRYKARLMIEKGTLKDEWKRRGEGRKRSVSWIRIFPLTFLTKLTN